MPSKQILYFGKECVVACDGRCDKAWGINGRPKKAYTDDPDDYVFLGDDALGTAPAPGETAICAEGVHGKPSASSITDGALMNRWCTRECERSVVMDALDAATMGVRLPDLTSPLPNLRSRCTT